MGEVYLAEDTRLKRQVALKFLPSEVANDAARLERFEREAQVVAGLTHPNIVTVHSIERQGDTLFIVMEYLDGRTLAEIIPRGGLPLDRLLSLATQIVDALVAAHGRGIVHRDLKPGNVMALAGDRVKVLDFGLAKLRDAPDAATLPTQDLTGEGRIVGTVAYMSPEQAEGKPVDERSDIFAVGLAIRGHLGRAFRAAAASAVRGRSTRRRSCTWCAIYSGRSNIRSTQRAAGPSGAKSLLNIS